MNVDYTTEARQDLFEAAEYYENREQVWEGGFGTKLPECSIRRQAPHYYGVNAKPDIGA